MPLTHISTFTFGILLILGGIIELVQSHAFILDSAYVEGFLLMTVGLFLTICGALPSRAHDEPSAKSSDVSDAVRREEIIRKEVIVKIRCGYCNAVFDETLDRCPHCGANH